MLLGLSDDQQFFQETTGRFLAEAAAPGGGSISGAGLVDLSLVAYEFGRHAAPGPLVTTNVVAATLSAQGAAPDVLGALLSGEGIATWCAPVAGPDGWRPTVEATRDGPDLVLRGEARPVESA